jgi:hypothetical protein
MRPPLCSISYMNFYEKALFVKPTWRPLYMAERKSFCLSRYASIRTFGEFTLLR